MKLLFRLLLVFFLSAAPALAQDSLINNLKQIQLDTTSNIQPLNFQEEQISEYKNDNDFSYLNVEASDNWWSRFKDWISMRYNQFIHWLFGDYEAGSFLSFFLQLLPYLLILAILAFAVWLFIRLNPGHYLLATPVEPLVYLSDEEKIIKSENIQELIDRAIKAEDYRLAVRYYYLQLLKLLNQKELIAYEFQKTDTDYLQEINREDFSLNFKKILRIYDFIWYGSFPISVDDFLKTQRNFENFKTSLKSLPNE